MRCVSSTTRRGADGRLQAQASASAAAAVLASAMMPCNLDGCTLKVFHAGACDVPPLERRSRTRPAPISSPQPSKPADAVLQSSSKRSRHEALQSSCATRKASRTADDSPDTDLPRQIMPSEEEQTMPNDDNEDADVAAANDPVQSVTSSSAAVADSWAGGDALPADDAEAEHWSFARLKHVLHAHGVRFKGTVTRPKLLRLMYAHLASKRKATTTRILEGAAEWARGPDGKFLMIDAPEKPFRSWCNLCGRSRPEENKVEWFKYVGFPRSACFPALGVLPRARRASPRPSCLPRSACFPRLATIILAAPC